MYSAIHVQQNTNKVLTRKTKSNHLTINMATLLLSNMHANCPDLTRIVHMFELSELKIDWHIPFSFHGDLKTMSLFLDLV